MDIKFVCNVLFWTKLLGLFLINVNRSFEKFVLKMLAHGTEILERKGTKNEDYPNFFLQNKYQTIDEKYPACAVVSQCETAYD